MRRGLATVVAFLATFVVGTATADAAFHLMKIREVGNSNPIDYVELQMYESGQNLVGGHYIQTYDENGDLRGTYEFPSNVPSGESQRTIIVVRTAGAFPVTPDFIAADAGPGNELPIGEDGAVCFLSTIAPFGAVDCVAHGAFAGNPSFQTGTPAPALTVTLPSGPGRSIHRTIAPGCSTLLEASDDTGDSATDFTVGPPSPRNNATVPTEKPCAKPDTKAPQTAITKKPKRRITKRKVKIAFNSSEAGSRFECKLDKRKFKPCDSPFKKGVGIGRHKFQVVATDKAGNADASPAKAKFRRVAKR